MKTRDRERVGKRGREGIKMFHVETATTTEFLHAAKSGLLTERRN